jgi:hypothetical protein
MTQLVLADVLTDNGVIHAVNIHTSVLVKNLNENRVLSSTYPSKVS